MEVVEVDVQSEDDDTIEKPTWLKSGVWQYFGFRKSLKVTMSNMKSKKNLKTVCSICRHEQNYVSGNTTNMTLHLSRKHGIDSSKLPNEKSLKKAKLDQPTLPQLMNNMEPYVTNSTMHKKLLNALAYMITADLQPLSIVEDRGFIQLMKTANPRFILPSRAFLTNHINTLYKEKRADLESVIALAEFVALTTDSWTSRNTEHFNTVTAHFVDKTWRMRHAVLQTTYSSESHTADYLSDYFKDLVENSWNLKRVMQVKITTDNAANVVKGVTQAGYLDIGYVKKFNLS